MIKIYFDSFTLNIRDNKSSKSDNFEAADQKHIFTEPSGPDIVNIMNTPPAIGTQVFIQSQDIESVLSKIKTQFRLIQAAGGLVYRDDGFILMIFRRGKWDLPKGKLDESEDLPTCALREVREETGLGQIMLGEKIMTTYHTYMEKSKKILKESHWYYMKSDGLQELVPQTEEDIEKCEWVLFKDVISYMPKTHPSIVDVLQKGFKL